MVGVQTTTSLHRNNQHSGILSWDPFTLPADTLSIVIDLTENNDTVYTEHTNTDLVLDSFGTSLAQTFLPRANDEIPSFPSPRLQWRN